MMIKNTILPRLIILNFTLFLIVFLIRVESSAQVSRPTYNTGKGFFVVGDKVYDKNGNEFLMRGVNMDNARVDQDHWDIKPAFNAIDNVPSVHFNSITINWEDRDSRFDANHLRDNLQRSIDNELVPVVDMHETLGSPDRARLQEAVDEVISLAPVWVPIRL